MIDRRRIVEQWKKTSARVLVTLVRAEGSSYRRPGARLLVGAAGEYVGTISGGCLEAEVVRKAEWMVREGAVVQRYSTMFDDTAEIPYGLGCGGVVDLLVEPVETDECSALLQAMERSLAGEEMLVWTWLPSAGRSLARVVCTAEREVVFASNGVSAEDLAWIRSAGVLEQYTSEEVFVERLIPPQRLFVLGAGEDAKPVAEFAALLGWSVTVADGRTQLAQAERFPTAVRVLVTTSASELRLRGSDAVVVMTHSYEQDRALLAELLGDECAGAVPGYIGLLGARHRSSLLVSEAAAQAGRSVEECCERVWAPVGLDLGGDGPEAVALAVIAEVQAWVQGRLGRSRRLTAQDVGEQIARGGASLYLQTQCAVGSSRAG